jgi:hypothetical protein
MPSAGCARSVRSAWLAAHLWQTVARGSASHLCRPLQPPSARTERSARGARPARFPHATAAHVRGETASACLRVRVPSVTIVFIRPTGPVVRLTGRAADGTGVNSEQATQSEMRSPMITVRSSGSRKYLTGLAALWAIARNSRLRQAFMPGASVCTIVICDRK